jgi:hypothetical protein
MNVKQIDPEDFNPVVITLTSQREVDTLRAITARVVSHGLDGEFSYDLYSELGKFSSPDPDVGATGTLHLKKTKGEEF